MSRGELRERAWKASQPCSLCELTVPHAFVDPGAHSWNPTRMSINPQHVLALLAVADCAAAVLRLTDTEAMSFEDDSVRKALGTLTTLRIALSAAAEL